MKVEYICFVPEPPLYLTKSTRDAHVCIDFKLIMKAFKFDMGNKGIHYFNNIAENYDSIRDSEILRPLLNSLISLDGEQKLLLDIGTGTGLFSTPVANKGYIVIGLDCNKNMLENAIRKARKENCIFIPILGIAESLPFSDSSLTTIISTNAIHHFILKSHLQEIIRVLKPNGYYIIFTRLAEQNRRSIWGSLFPGFATKENRLFSRGNFISMSRRFKKLNLVSIDEIRFPKPFDSGDMVNKAISKCYSTFSFYDKREFKKALDVFYRGLNNWEKSYYYSEIARIIFQRG